MIPSRIEVSDVIHSGSEDEYNLAQDEADLVQDMMTDYEGNTLYRILFFIFYVE